MSVLRASKTCSVGDGLPSLKGDNQGHVTSGLSPFASSFQELAKSNNTDTTVLRDAGTYGYQDGSRGDYIDGESQSDDKSKLHISHSRQVLAVNANPCLWTSRDDSFEEDTLGESIFTAYEVENGIDGSGNVSAAYESDDAESWVPSELSDDDGCSEGSEDLSNDMSVTWAWERNIHTLHPSAAEYLHPPLHPLPASTPPPASVQRESTLPQDSMPTIPLQHPPATGSARAFVDFIQVYGLSYRRKQSAESYTDIHGVGPNEGKEACVEGIPDRYWSDNGAYCMGKDVV